MKDDPHQKSTVLLRNECTATVYEKCGFVGKSDTFPASSHTLHHAYWESIQTVPGCQASLVNSGTGAVFALSGKLFKTGDKVYYRNGKVSRSKSPDAWFKLPASAELPHAISITSYNEWGEGTQIEEAVAHGGRDDYGEGGPGFYMQRTAEWVNRTRDACHLRDKGKDDFARDEL